MLRPLRTTNYTVYTESDLRFRWHRHHRGRCERHHAFTHNGSVTQNYTKSQKHMLHRTQSIFVTRARDTNAKAARGRMSPPLSLNARRMRKKITNMDARSPIGRQFPMGVDAFPKCTLYLDCLVVIGRKACRGGI